MLVLQSHQCLFTSSAFSLPHRHHTTRLISLHRPPESISPISAFTRIQPDRIRVSAVKEIADVPEQQEEEDGPYELPPSSTSPFSSTNSLFATSRFTFTTFSVLLKHQILHFSCRTIINGICYLATFVFGLNAIGLLLYSGQLFFNEESDDAMKATTEPGDSSGDNSEVNKSNEDQSSGD